MTAVGKAWQEMSLKKSLESGAMKGRVDGGNTRMRTIRESVFLQELVVAGVELCEPDSFAALLEGREQRQVRVVWFRLETGFHVKLL